MTMYDVSAAVPVVIVKCVWNHVRKRLSVGLKMRMDPGPMYPILINALVVAFVPVCVRVVFGA